MKSDIDDIRKIWILPVSRTCLNPSGHPAISETTCFGNRMSRGINKLNNYCRLTCKNLETDCSTLFFTVLVFVLLRGYCFFNMISNLFEIIERHVIQTFLTNLSEVGSIQRLRLTYFSSWPSKPNNILQTWAGRTACHDSSGSLMVAAEEGSRWATCWRRSAAACSQYIPVLGAGPGPKWETLNTD